MPMIRGPYCTGALAPSGACAFVPQPQLQRTVSSRCPVVTGFTGGMPMTCRRSTAVTGAFFRDFPQQEHLAGRRPTVLSGCSDSSIVAPGRPFGRPGFRPDFPRSDFGDGLAGPSDDGGFDEFREFAFTCDRSSARASRSAAFSTASSAIRASRPASSPRSRAFAARSPGSPLPGTPAVSGTDERCHDTAPPANRQASKLTRPAGKHRRRQKGRQAYLVAVTEVIRPAVRKQLQHIRRSDCVRGLSRPCPANLACEE